jgi:hypothetical protein
MVNLYYLINVNNYIGVGEYLEPAKASTYITLSIIIIYKTLKPSAFFKRLR